ncbi:MAG TPA: FAD-dependent oxidoreductase [Anaerolineaceae bacterium]|nr:FAD-dependent oxidoreductase [Anaerolineaceae bacterium]
MRYLIIGSGVAGIAACEAIRSLDSAGEIILASEDPHGYYSRPGLAYYLANELPEKLLFPLDANGWRRLNLSWLGDRAVRLYPEARQVAFAKAGRLGYDRLLLAVGSSAAPLTTPGADCQGVVKLDHLEDARQILKQARRGRTAVVVGGGITALELVEGLAARKVRVHYLLRGERYWNNVLDAEESEIVLSRLRHEGVTIHTGAEVGEILDGRGQVGGVRLTGGEIIRCNLVAYAIGIRPRLELAVDAGLAVDRGVLVDERLQTSAPDVYAAGDVAQVYDPVSGRSVLDSLWGPAREQGYAAGLNMAGQAAAYRKPVAYNVTRLTGLTTTIIGAVGSGRDLDMVSIARGDSETWREAPAGIVADARSDVNRLRLLVGETTLLGAVVMGDQTLSRPLQRLISDAIDVTPIRSALLAPGAQLGELILTFWHSIQAKGSYGT